MPTVLVSGFGPFPPHADNPSWDALIDAQPRLPPQWRMDRVRLDVAWQRAAEALLPKLDGDVRVVIAFGLADDPALRVERFAINASNALLTDIDGTRFEDDTIITPGPAAYTTGLPRRQLLDALTGAGYPAIESHFAGGYLCNHTFYRLMHAVADRPDITAGFVHVPPTAKLALPRTRAAMELIIETVVGYSVDSSAR